MTLPFPTRTRLAARCLGLTGLAFCAALLSTPSSLEAQSTWTNPFSSDWDNAANWDTAFFPNAADADAVFNAGLPLFNSTVTLNAVDITVGTIQINNATSSTITDRTITFNDSSSAQIQFNSGNWTIASDIVLDSSLTLTGGSSGTVSGSIADGAANSIVKSGAGTVILSSNNTFTGTTQVNAGVLQLDALNALGGTSAVTLNGGATLRQNAVGPVINNAASVTLNDTSVFDLNGSPEVIGSLAGGAATSVTLGAGSLTTGVNNSSTNYAGIISGTGGLTKQGAGTQTLSGANTYTGPTSVNGGRLDVNGSLNSAVTINGGGTFGGTGSVPSVVATAGSVVAPGNSIGTLTIAGNGTPAFTQAAGSTYQAEINNGGTVPGVNNDLVLLTNAAATVSLAGTVNVQDTTGGGFYDAGTTYTILQTANPNGVGGETYDSVMDNLAIRDAVLIHNPNSVQVQLLRIAGDFAANSNTRNQRAVGTVLDGVNALAVGDLGAVLDQMVQLPNAQKAAVLDQLSGEIHASAAGNVVHSTGRFIDMVSRRLRSNSTGATGLYGPTVAPGAAMLMGSRPSIATGPFIQTSGGEFVVRAQGLGEPMFGGGYGSAAMAPLAPTVPSWGSTWASGYGVGGDVDGDGNGNPFDYDMAGTVFGIERNLTPLFLMGLVGGYSHSNVDMNRPRSSAEVDSYHAGVYAHLTEGIAYSTALVAYGYQDYDTTRQIMIPGPMPITRSARANYHGDELSAYFEKGLNLSYAGWRIQPLVGIQYIAMEREDFRETGAGAVGLLVNEDHVNSLRLSAGGRIAPELPEGFFGAIIPELRGRFVHELLDDDQAISASFAGAPGGNFIVNSAELGRNFGIVGAGLNAQLTPAVNLFVDYDFTFSSSLEAHAGSGGLEFLW